MTPPNLAAIITDETGQSVSVADLSDPTLAKRLHMDALDLLGIQNRIDCEFGDMPDHEIEPCLYDARPFVELCGRVGCAS